MTIFHTDGTDTGIAMRATEKGRDTSLVAMVLGDRKDAENIAKAARRHKAAVYAAQMTVSYDKAANQYNSGWIDTHEWRWYCFFWEWCCFRHTYRQERAYARLGSKRMYRRYARVSALRARLAKG